MTPLAFLLFSGCSNGPWISPSVRESLQNPPIVPSEPTSDMDQDGLSDEEEMSLGTDPNDDDSDDDGLTDGNELPLHTDPTLFDTDNDGLGDGQEVGLILPQGVGTPFASFRRDQDPSSVTDPTNPDTDNDGLTDGQEDDNKNGAVNPTETDPNKADTDSDGLSDGEEVTEYETDPLVKDTDGDGVEDGPEVFGYGLGNNCLSDPLLEDSDNDGLTDPDECTFQTNPLDDDTDDDGLTDGQEWNGLNLNPKDPDSDDDGLTDGQELGLSIPNGEGTDTALFVPDGDPSTTTDPLDDDTDGDTLLDGEEDTDLDGEVDPEELDPNVPNSTKYTDFTGNPVPRLTFVGGADSCIANFLDFSHDGGPNGSGGQWEFSFTFVEPPPLSNAHQILFTRGSRFVAYHYNHNGTNHILSVTVQEGEERFMFIRSDSAQDLTLEDGDVLTIAFDKTNCTDPTCLPVAGSEFDLLVNNVSVINTNAPDVGVDQGINQGTSSDDLHFGWPAPSYGMSSEHIGSGFEAFSGKIDNLVLFNRVLDPVEREEIVHISLYTVSNQTTPQPLMWLNMGEDYGTLPNGEAALIDNVHLTPQNGNPCAAIFENGAVSNIIDIYP